MKWEDLIAVPSEYEYVKKVFTVPCLLWANSSFFCLLINSRANVYTKKLSIFC